MLFPILSVQSMTLIYISVSEMAQIRAGEEAEAFMRKIDEY
jgi:hypothetical protein